MHNKRTYIHIMLLLMISIQTIAETHRMIFRMDKTSKLITFLGIKDDPAHMNWIIPANGSIYPWINKKEYQWGTIKQDIPVGTERISIKTCMRRTILGYNIIEEYTIENLSSVPLDLSQISICTPWNARYLDIDSVQSKRCTLNIFLRNEGSSVTCIKATRVNGKGPHMGLMVTKGDISAWYSGNCNDISDSSTCALMYVVPEKTFLRPGKKYTLEWHLFSYDNDNDFIKCLQQRFGKDIIKTYNTQQWNTTSETLKRSGSPTGRTNRPTR